MLPSKVWNICTPSTAPPIKTCQGWWNYFELTQHFAPTLNSDSKTSSYLEATYQLESEGPYCSLTACHSGTLLTLKPIDHSKIDIQQTHFGGGRVKRRRNTSKYTTTRQREIVQARNLKATKEGTWKKARKIAWRRHFLMAIRTYHCHQVDYQIDNMECVIEAYTNFEAWIEVTMMVYT